MQVTLLRLRLLAELPQQWTLMNDMGYFELEATVSQPDTVNVVQPL